MDCSRFLAALFVAGAACAILAGCNRGFYRRQADADAQRLIREKTFDTRWCLPGGASIDIDPQSRMFDPFSADHPPLPPDDPAAAQFMEQVDCKPGYPQWHFNGDTDYVENPDWMSYLPVNDEGVIELNLQRSVNLSLIHSPVYQRAREDLYLSALDVSLERFGFDVTMFSGLRSNLTTRSDGTSSFDIGSAGTSFGASRTVIQKAGITGTSLAVGLANSIIWDFGGGATDQRGAGLLDFAIVQPFLRGAGRKVVLESLTQAERTLLGNVRRMERFRRGYYLEITNGRGAEPGPTRFGTFLGTPRSGTGFAGGFMGLLRDQQSIRIQEFNVIQLRSVLEQFRQFKNAERIDDLQVRQTEISVYDAEIDLINARNDYDTSLDSFKLTMGLPPSADVKINDPLLDQFELIDDENNLRLSEIDSVQSQVGVVLLEAQAIVNKQNESVLRKQDYTLVWTDELAEKLAKLNPLLDNIDPYIEKIGVEDAARVRQDIEALRKIRPIRVESLQKLKELVASGTGYESDLDTSILQDDAVVTPETLTSEYEDVMRNLDKIKTAVAAMKSLVADLKNRAETLDPKELFRQVDDLILSEIPELLSKLGNVSLELSLVQAQARTDSIMLPEVDLASNRALEIAREFRRDWMNARSSLVDEWRQIEISANALETDLAVILDGSIGNGGKSNPLNIDYSSGVLRAGFRIDAPINRFSERNQYRETLIQYQRARRDFYRFGDEVSRGLRQSIRIIDLNKFLFELNRVSIKVNVKLVEQARLRLDRPPRGVGGDNQLGATTARDLVGAINGLQRSQNIFLNTWVQYEVLRRNLDFDLGTMQLTVDSVWIDPGKIDESIGLREDVSCDLADPGRIYVDPTAEGGMNPIFEPQPTEPGPETAPKTAPPEVIPDPPSVDPNSSGGTVPSSFAPSRKASNSGESGNEIRWESFRLPDAIKL